MPSWKNLKIFLLGAAWVALLSLGPVAWTLYEWLTDPSDPSISWPKLRGLVLTCAGPAVVAYWRKHKALLDECPPEIEDSEAEPKKDL